MGSGIVSPSSRDPTMQGLTAQPPPQPSTDPGFLGAAGSVWEEGDCIEGDCKPPAQKSLDDFWTGLLGG